jgi:ribosomal protein L35
VLRRKAMKSHNLEKKSPKRKRAFTRAQKLHESNVKAVKKLLGGQ